MRDLSEVMQSLEIARSHYLSKARKAARQIALDGDGTCTVNDVRAIEPPPENIDGRVMGAIFGGRDWELDRYEKSTRAVCHKRPIARFKYVGV
jgi:hypothetical protein